MLYNLSLVLLVDQECMKDTKYTQPIIVRDEMIYNTIKCYKPTRERPRYILPVSATMTVCLALRCSLPPLKENIRNSEKYKSIDFGWIGFLPKIEHQIRVVFHRYIETPIHLLDFLFSPEARSI